MSLIPAFHLGFWNAWLMMLFYPLHPLIMVALDKAVGSGDIFKKMGSNDTYTEREKLDSTTITVGMVFLSLYSIFLPLRTGTAWLWTGLILYLAGLTVFLSSVTTAAATPPDQPFTRGMYRWSRNPMYLAFLFLLVGVGIATTSWIFLGFSLYYFMVMNSQVASEEQRCLEVYGAAYRDYLERTSRWLGIPK